MRNQRPIVAVDTKVPWTKEYIKIHFLEVRVHICLDVMGRPGPGGWEDGLVRKQRPLVTVNTKGAMDKRASGQPDEQASHPSLKNECPNRIGGTCHSQVMGRPDPRG